MRLIENLILKVSFTDANWCEICLHMYRYLIFLRKAYISLFSLRASQSISLKVVVLVVVVVVILCKTFQYV